MQMFLNDLNGIFKSTNDTIIIPLETYKSKLIKSYNTLLKEFEELISRYKTCKNDLLKAQSKYYNSCMDVSKEKDTNSDIYMRLISQKDINSQIYKYEIEHANKQYQRFDKDYFKLYEKIHKVEDSRLQFSHNQIDSFLLTFNKFNKISQELTVNVQSKVSQWKLEKDVQLFKEEFNYGNFTTHIRFNKENFIHFDMNSANQLNNSNNLKENLLSKGKKIISFLGEYEIIDRTENENFQKNIIVKILFFIESEDEIPVDVLAIAFRLISSDRSFSITLIKSYIDKHQTNYFNMPNFNNLFHLGNLFNAIILNCDLDKDSMNNLYIAIIVISQKVYSIKESYDYSPKDKYFNKVFLCGVISKNQVFKSHSFWYDVIECKFKSKMNFVKTTIVEKDKEYKANLLKEEKIKKQNMIDNPSTGHSRSLTYTLPTNPISASSMLGSIGSGFKSFFVGKETAKPVTKTGSNKNLPAQKKKVNNEFVNVLQFTQYETLDKKYRLEFNQKCFAELYSIIKEFIPYFINFSFGLTNSIDFIVSICNKFNVSNELINYYVICLSSASYSVRQHPPKTPTDSTLRSNIENFKSNRTDAIFTKYPIYKGIKSLKENEKNVILGNAVVFLDPQTKMNCILLSKKHEKYLKKIVYRSVLQEEISTEKRLQIWESILKVNSIKKKISYEVSVKEALAIDYDRFSNNSFAIIDLDVQRTMFDENTEKSREAINNVLKTITHLKPDINYFQGMNFIASFLYRLTKSEERTFYLIMGLFTTTKFGKIFFEDLKKLKLYFNIFDKILFLYLPVLNTFFKNNNILTNYYLSAWMITLFTSTISKGNSLNAITKIWDNFLISGWKSVFTASLSLMELQEKQMLEMKTEPLLLFLSGDIVKKYLFVDDEDFIEMINKNIVKNQLLHNLKNELKHENELTTEGNVKK